MPRTAGNVCGLLALPELLTRRRPREPDARVDVHERGRGREGVGWPPGPALWCRRSGRSCCLCGDVAGNRTLLADMVIGQTLGRPTTRGHSHAHGTSESAASASASASASVRPSAMGALSFGWSHARVGPGGLQAFRRRGRAYVCASACAPASLNNDRRSCWHGHYALGWLESLTPGTDTRH